MSILFKIAVVISHLDPKLRPFSRALSPQIKGSRPEKNVLKVLIQQEGQGGIIVGGLMVGVGVEVGFRVRVTKLALSCQHRLVNVGGALQMRSCYLQMLCVVLEDNENFARNQKRTQ